MNELHLTQEVLMALISAISAICAAIALLISIRANGLAKRSLEFSKRSLLIDKRPFITMNPVRSTKTGKYIDITSNESGFVLELGYEVKNSGDSPASNLSAPRILKLSGPQNWQFNDISYGAPPRISLGPQEARVMLLRADLKLSDPTAADKLRDSNEEDKVAITAGMALDYSSEYFPDTSFSVTSTHRISKERAETLAYDFSSRQSEKL